MRLPHPALPKRALPVLLATGETDRRSYIPFDIQIGSCLLHRGSDGRVEVGAWPLGAIPTDDMKSGSHGWAMSPGHNDL